MIPADMHLDPVLFRMELDQSALINLMHINRGHKGNLQQTSAEQIQTSACYEIVCLDKPFIKDMTQGL